jgi:pimeloyl-CoA synthetase
MIGLEIEKCIKETVNRVLADKNGIPDVEYIETDSLGEVIEKLTILHIRTWMLEDAIQAAATDEEIASLKRKIDICFKVKRPKYVEAINLMVSNSISKNKSLLEESVKFYKGRSEAK